VVIGAPSLSGVDACCAGVDYPGYTSRIAVPIATMRRAFHRKVLGRPVMLKRICTKNILPGEVCVSHRRGLRSPPVCARTFSGPGRPRRCCHRYLGSGYYGRQSHGSLLASDLTPGLHTATVERQGFATTTAKDQHRSKSTIGSEESWRR
jgi:hypothetical protein